MGIRGTQRYHRMRGPFIEENIAVSSLPAQFVTNAGSLGHIYKESVRGALQWEETRFYTYLPVIFRVALS
jgi:hypothetical protein